MNVERFWSKVNKDGPYRIPLREPCWLWTASLDGKGYGQFLVSGKLLRAHRVAYNISTGAIPTGLELDHVCRERRCVNPSHLQPVNHRENCKRCDLSKNGQSQRVKTHCPSGHEYDTVNTYINPTRGVRVCKPCKIHFQRIRRDKSAQMASAGNTSSAP